MIYPQFDKDQVKHIASVYFDAVDKEGFIFDFDQAKLETNKEVVN